MHCGLPVDFENDANAAAYGEFWVGSGREFQSMALLTLGTGIGCGIIIGDLVVQGAHSHGGENGTSSSTAAKMPGCVAAAPADIWKPMPAPWPSSGGPKNCWAGGRTSPLSGRIAGGEEPTPKLIAEEAEQGDELSNEIIRETARYLGVGVVNLMHTIDPEAVLLGGAMTFGGSERELGRQFLEMVRGEVRRHRPAHSGQEDRDRFRQPGRRCRLHRRGRRGPAGIFETLSLNGGLIVRRSLSKIPGIAIPGRSHRFAIKARIPKNRFFLRKTFSPSLTVLYVSCKTS